LIHTHFDRFLKTELGDGHYWQNADLRIDKPLRIVGDENNPSNVIIELKGTITWAAKGGMMDGITLRRPNFAATDSPVGALLELEKGGKLDISQCVLDNEGCNGNVININGPGPNGFWTNSIFQCGYVGINLLNGAVVTMEKVRLLFSFKSCCIIFATNRSFLALSKHNNL
jgi:hypothetical protein